jgi:D-apionolactonase
LKWWSTADSADGADGPKKLARVDVGHGHGSGKANSMLTDEFLRLGLVAAPAALIELRAGPLRLHYDPVTGSVRWFKRGGREVLRGIYFALRDRNWGTVPGQLIERQREVGADAFRIEFECEHRQAGIHFTWHGQIEGTSDGTVRYDCDGEGRSAFLKNRIGFCVLHPIRECAGARARQSRTGGAVIEGELPRAIEPQIFGQANFQDLHRLAHEIELGCWAELAFEGEVFEMEDQRNWTDASFKTYCTPLARPFPVEFKPGERVRQSVTLRLIEDSSASGTVARSGPEEERVTLEWRDDGKSGRMPELGLGLASDDEPLSELETERLRALRLDHVRHDARLARGSWVPELERALEQCGRLGMGLELAVHLPQAGAAGLPELRARLERWRVGTSDQSVVPEAHPRIKRILVLREGEAATTRESMELARGFLGDLGASFGAGSDRNFCELNREQALGRLGLEAADFLFWSINPQVHAVDSWSVMETIEAQGATVRTARAFAGDRPLAVSPLTLKQRFNPVATGPEPELGPEALPPQVDPRQLSLFAAAWTVGSLAALAEAGAASATYYETVGWRGIMARGQGAQNREGFPAEPGMLFPVYAVFAAVRGYEQWQAVASSDPGRVIAWGLRGSGGRRRLLLANLTAHPVETWIQGLAGAWQARELDLGNARRAFHDPGSFWALPGEPLPERGAGRLLRTGGYGVVVADAAFGVFPGPNDSHADRAAPSIPDSCSGRNRISATSCGTDQAGSIGPGKGQSSRGGRATVSLSNRTFCRSS